MIKMDDIVAQRFAWAVDWFDEDGFKINDNQHVWEPVSLGGYGSTYITITAPTYVQKPSIEKFGTTHSVSARIATLTKK